MGENDNKNHIDHLEGKRVMFNSEYQPTPEAKSKGWEKRRIKQEIMDLIARLDTMSMEELDILRKDIEANPDKHTVREARLVRYMTREKFLIDYLDRNVGKAPQDIDIKSDGEGMNKIIIEHIHSKDGTTTADNESYKSI